MVLGQNSCVYYCGWRVLLLSLSSSGDPAGSSLSVPLPVLMENVIWQLVEANLVRMW